MMTNFHHLGTFLLLIVALSSSEVSAYKRSSRHHRPREISTPKSTTRPTISPLGACDGWWCGAGKQCEIGSDGLAKCGCVQECPKESSSPVCGTDGSWYSTHCELHRKNCLSTDGPQLSIDHTATSCPQFKPKNNKNNNKDKKNKNKGKRGQQKLDGGNKGGLSENDVRDYNYGAKYGEDKDDAKFIEKKVTKKQKWSKDEDNLLEDIDDEDELDDDEDDDDDEEDDEELELDQELKEQEDEELAMDGQKVENRPFLTTTFAPPPVRRMSQQRPVFPSSSSSRQEIRPRDSSTNRCSPQEYEILKDNLLLYNHERMIGGVRNFKAAMEGGKDGSLDGGGGEGPEAGKDYLLSLIFSHFDKNNNGALEYEELQRVRSGGVSVISLDKALETTHVTASVGDNVEIKCDVSGSPPMPIVWRRYGVDLSSLNQDEQIRVFPDGTLYLNKIQLLHAGNYSCHAQRNQEVIQTHVLTVQNQPDVRVMPHIVWEQPGCEVSFECRVTGEPFPVVQWLKNDEPLPVDMGDKYVVTGDGIRLTLKDIYFSDTGAYMCKSQNSAGKRLDIGSLVVIDQQTPATVQINESQFLVFHSRGISVYDPSTCRIQHQIQGTDIIPGTQDYVCGDHTVSCDWGRAIRVSSSYVYVSQPKLDRVLVISNSQMVVVDMVPTDRFPVELHYVPHLDQVWVECWRSDETPTQKTLQVIREGKVKRKHHTVHPEPIDSHFDLVEHLFIPPDSESSSQFRYAYVGHKNGRGLYKMDLVALRYTKSVDLTPYNCVPQHIQFSSLYGMVIVECFEPVTNRATGQLVLDALTDSVVYYKENGLEFSFDVKTSLNISDVTFFPSQRSHTYDLYASSVDKDDVLFVDLESGKVEMVSGVSAIIGDSNWRSPPRSISSQGLFSKYLATPSADAVFVLNGQTHTINCQIGGLTKPGLIVWL
ncbi:Follistatin-related protein 5 [Folsomia candida]|uniref:Follistatin-related protein 5 n=1 Tax=Folsomia candida TaxID=158441 RepID=A0A226EN90_FOLCA|nr:Follistatin-related protein 5 [Folsomia candida]